mgnify:CR=1 FL=1
MVPTERLGTIVVLFTSKHREEQPYNVDIKNDHTQNIVIHLKFMLFPPCNSFSIKDQEQTVDHSKYRIANRRENTELECPYGKAKEQDDEWTCPNKSPPEFRCEVCLGDHSIQCHWYCHSCCHSSWYYHPTCLPISWICGTYRWNEVGFGESEEKEKEIIPRDFPSKLPEAKEQDNQKYMHTQRCPEKP